MAKWLAKNEYDTLPSPPMKMPPLIWRFFYGRGIKDKNEIDEYFSPKLKDLTHPLKLHDMDRAIERLIKAIDQNEKICIYGDFDLDGTSGLALLKAGLEGLGVKNLTYYQPKRLSEGYGLHSHAVENLHKEGVNLLLTVDLGITAVTPVEVANRLGIDVIITDHHLPAEKLPEAFAIVNPNKGYCTSNLGHLCGAGVGFYLILALKMELEKRGALASSFDPKQLLDCLTIATLTDLVPLKKENRILVKHGLTVLRQTKRPALKALMQSLGLGGEPLSGNDVAIRFAPKLNALSRMDGAILPLDLYLEEDPKKSHKMVEKVLKVNDQRVNLQNKAQKIAEDCITRSKQAGFIYVAHPEFHQGIVGLVATRLMQAHNVPTFVGAEKEDGTIVGSARLPDVGFPSLVDALAASSEALIKFGGHKQAAGFELKVENHNAFEKCLSQFYQNFYEHNNAPEVEVFFDMQSTLAEMTPEFMNWLGALEPFGKDFESPVIKVSDTQIKSVRTLRGGHIKLSLQCQKTKLVRDAIWFSPPENKGVTEKLDLGQSIEVLAQPQWNHYNGISSIQLLIKDLKLSGH